MMWEVPKCEALLFFFLFKWFSNVVITLPTPVIGKATDVIIFIYV